MAERNSWEDYEDVRQRIDKFLKILWYNARQPQLSIQERKIFESDEKDIDRGSSLELRNHYINWTMRVQDLMREFDRYIDMPKID